MGLYQGGLSRYEVGGLKMEGAYRQETADAQIWRRVLWQPLGGRPVPARSRDRPHQQKMAWSMRTVRGVAGEQPAHARTAQTPGCEHYHTGPVGVLRPPADA
jgi:hypothetical protein